MAAGDPIDQWPDFLRGLRMDLEAYRGALVAWRDHLLGPAEHPAWTRAQRLILLQMIETARQRSMCRSIFVDQEKSRQFKRDLESHYGAIESLARKYVDGLRRHDIACRLFSDDFSVTLQAQLLDELTKDLPESRVGLNYLKESLSPPVLPQERLVQGAVTRVIIPHHLPVGTYTLYAQPAEDPEINNAPVATLLLHVRGPGEIKASRHKLLVARQLALSLDAHAAPAFQITRVYNNETHELHVFAGTTLHIRNNLNRDYALIQPYDVTWVPGPGPLPRMQRLARHELHVPDHLPDGAHTLWCVSYPNMAINQQLVLDVTRDGNQPVNDTIIVQVSATGALTHSAVALGSNGPRIRPGSSVYFETLGGGVELRYSVLAPWRATLPILHPARLDELASHADTGFWTVKPEGVPYTPPNVSEKRRDDAIALARSLAGGLATMTPALLTLETLNYREAHQTLGRALGRYDIALPPLSSNAAYSDINEFMTEVTNNQRSYLRNAQNLQRLGVGMALVSLSIDVWKTHKALTALYEAHTENGTLELGAAMKDVEKGFALFASIHGLVDNFQTTRTMLAAIDASPDITLPPVARDWLQRAAGPASNIFAKVGTGIKIIEAALALKVAVDETKSLDYDQAIGAYLRFGGASVAVSAELAIAAVGMTTPLFFLSLAGLIIAGGGQLVEVLYGKNPVEDWASQTWFGDDNRERKIKHSAYDTLTLKLTGDPDELAYRFLQPNGTHDLSRMITHYFSMLYWPKKLEVELVPDYYLRDLAAFRALQSRTTPVPLQFQLHGVPPYLHGSFKIDIKVARYGQAEQTTVFSGAIKDLTSHKSGEVRTFMLDLRDWIGDDEHWLHWVETDIQLPTGFYSSLLQLSPADTLGSSSLSKGPGRLFGFVIRNRTRIPWNSGFKNTNQALWE